MSSCGSGGNDPGVEYAPQMYHSIPYEPLTQITEESVPDGFISSWYYETFVNSIPYNDYKGAKPMNQLKPVEGTIPRQIFEASYAANSVPAASDTSGRELMKYDIHKDSLDLASRMLTNPLSSSEEVLEDGKALYISFCSACHGMTGKGDGKVGQVYKGVPNYSVGRYATLSEGHVYHVITHGKGRMWAHKSQLSPEERWKVVRYVQKLQKGES